MGARISSSHSSSPPPHAPSSANETCLRDNPDDINVRQYPVLTLTEPNPFDDDRAHEIPCPEFSTRTVSPVTAGPCYVLRDLVYAKVSLRLNARRLYARVCQRLRCEGNVRMSLSDGVLAIREHGHDVFDMHHKRRFRKIINHFHFQRLRDLRTALLLLQSEHHLVGAIYRTPHGSTFAVTLYGVSENAAVVRAKCYGSERRRASPHAHHHKSDDAGGVVDGGTGGGETVRYLELPVVSVDDHPNQPSSGTTTGSATLLTDFWAITPKRPPVPTRDGCLLPAL